MPSDPFNTSFTKKFRPEQSVSFCAEEKPIQNILISTYSPFTDAEINSLGQSLNEQLLDNNVIHRLLTKLTQKDNPDNERLSAFIQETHQELRSHANAEPFTAQYYKHLIELLTSFHDLITEYDANGQELLLGNLNTCYSHEPGFAIMHSVDSEEVSTMHRIIEDYLYQVRKQAALLPPKAPLPPGRQVSKP